MTAHVLSVIGKRTPSIAQWVAADAEASRLSGHKVGCDCQECVKIRVEAVRAGAVEERCYEWTFSGAAASLAIVALDSAICVMASRRESYLSWRACCSCTWSAGPFSRASELMGPCTIHLIGASLAGE